MVCRCVAAGCSKTHRDGVQLFLFPKDARLKQMWAAEVRKTRDKWQPTKHSVLCNEHFEDFCFEKETSLSKAMGLGKWKPRLKCDAVPTIFKKPSLKRKIPAAEPEPKKRRTAYEKRERSRVSSRISCRPMH